jgi:[protein-PII] uridylyltransferase
VFRRIVGRMQHDLFHVYTVDQHILMVLRNVRRFFIPEHAHEYPFCSQLAARLGQALAALRGGALPRRGQGPRRRPQRPRREGGAALLPRPRHRRRRHALIEFLVQHHLTMSRVAQKEDLSDPEVIARFARLVGTPRRLTALYLLTVADIRGTSPKVWNAWKGKLLEDLYRTDPARPGRRQAQPAGRDRGAQAEARQRWRCTRRCPAPRSRCGRRWTRATSRATTPATSPGTRARCGATSTPQKPVVRARPRPVGEGLQVLVYAPDRPDLFARICGYFDGAGFSILDAKVHTTRAGLCARHLPGRHQPCGDTAQRPTAT